MKEALLSNCSLSAVSGLHTENMVRGETDFPKCRGVNVLPCATGTQHARKVRQHVLPKDFYLF